MPKKAPLRLRIAPVQIVVAEPITDPAEQAEIDEARKRAKERRRGRKAKAKRDTAK